MIRMQGEDAIHGPFDYGVDLVLFGRHAKHHVQEVAGIGEALRGCMKGWPMEYL